MEFLSDGMPGHLKKKDNCRRQFIQWKNNTSERIRVNLP